MTQKEKADGQKSQLKGRIVAKGYQEGKKPQSDSPTLLRESLKMYFAVAANEGFKLRSIDIREHFYRQKVWTERYIWSHQRILESKENYGN